ncbi:MAG: DUF167 domain-containing protein [Bryobacteraceae bacterium]|nr:DUF167 domain-containing protein [Bryobacteraceae bacterium]
MDLDSLKAELSSRGELRLAVKVIPKAARTELAGLHSEGVWRIRIQAPPEKGKANAELCRFLAKLFGVSARQVLIVSGETSTHKQLMIVRG